MTDILHAYGPALLTAFGLVLAGWLLRTLRKLLQVLTAISSLAEAQLQHNGGATLLDRVANIEKTLREQANITRLADAAKARALADAASELRVATEHITRSNP